MGVANLGRTTRREASLSPTAAAPEYANVMSWKSSCFASSFIRFIPDSKLSWVQTAPSMLIPTTSTLSDISDRNGMAKARATGPSIYKKVGLRIGWAHGKTELILSSGCDLDTFVSNLMVV